MSEKPFKWIYRSKVSGLIYDNENAAGDCEAIPLYRLTSDAVVNRLNEEIAALRAKIAKASSEARTASTLIAPSAVAEPSRYLVIKCHIDAALKELE